MATLNSTTKLLQLIQPFYSLSCYILKTTKIAWLPFLCALIIYTLCVKAPLTIFTTNYARRIRRGRRNSIARRWREAASLQPTNKICISKGNLACNHRHKQKEIANQLRSKYQPCRTRKSKKNNTTIWKLKILLEISLSKIINCMQITLFMNFRRSFNWKRREL